MLIRSTPRRSACTRCADLSQNEHQSRIERIFAREHPTLFFGGTFETSFLACGNQIRVHNSCKIHYQALANKSGCLSRDLSAEARWGCAEPVDFAICRHIPPLILPSQGCFPTRPQHRITLHYHSLRPCASANDRHVWALANDHTTISREVASDGFSARATTGTKTEELRSELFFCSGSVSLPPSWVNTFVFTCIQDLIRRRSKSFGCSQQRVRARIEHGPRIVRLC